MLPGGSPGQSQQILDSPSLPPASAFWPPQGRAHCQLGSLNTLTSSLRHMAYMHMAPAPPALVLGTCFGCRRQGVFLLSRAPCSQPSPHPLPGPAPAPLGLHSMAGSQCYITLIWPPEAWSPRKTQPGIVFLQPTSSCPHQLCEPSVEGVPEKEDSHLQPGWAHTTWQRRNRRTQARLD